MKKVILLIVFVLFASVSHSATYVETTLDAPEVVTEPVTKIRQVSFEWLADRFAAKFLFLDASGNTVEERYCVLTGADFDTGDAATVNAGQVGQTYKSIVQKYIQGKCKTLWGLTGTE